MRINSRQDMTPLRMIPSGLCNFSNYRRYDKTSWIYGLITAVRRHHVVCRLIRNYTKNIACHRLHHSIQREKLGLETILWLCYRIIYCHYCCVGREHHLVSLFCDRWRRCKKFGRLCAEQLTVGLFLCWYCDVAKTSSLVIS
jgi:hypothetical protein